MISFQKTDRQLIAKHKLRLKQLYLQAFTKGISAQYISEDEAKRYLDDLFSKGYGVFAFSENELIAVLISIPPSQDQECPEEIQTKYADADTEYIAEVLVDENFRGIGLGRKLMQAYEDQLSETTKQVLLRVWDQNEAAVNLYKKTGFVECGQLTQTKLKPISKEVFTMHKIYMLKTF